MPAARASSPLEKDPFDRRRRLATCVTLSLTTWLYVNTGWAIRQHAVDIRQLVLREETGLGDVFLEQLYTFGGLDRDPRGRVVSVAYYALVNLVDHRLQSGTDARAARWVPVQEAQGLAFDHDKILTVALERLRAKVRYQPIGFEMLPERFKLSQLQALYEAILGRPLDKRNFRKRFLAMGLLTQTGEERGVPHRAARLFRFDKRRHETLRRKGFDFEI